MKRRSCKTSWNEIHLTSTTLLRDKSFYSVYGLREKGNGSEGREKVEIWFLPFLFLLPLRPRAWFKTIAFSIFFLRSSSRVTSTAYKKDPWKRRGSGIVNNIDGKLRPSRFPHYFCSLFFHSRLVAR